MHLALSVCMTNIYWCLLLTFWILICPIMTGTQRQKAGAAARSSAPFDIESLQHQLVELSNEENGYTSMIELIQESKKAKMSPEDKTIVNMAVVLVPFIMINKSTNETVNKLKVSVEKKQIKLENPSLSSRKA